MMPKSESTKAKWTHVRVRRSLYENLKKMQAQLGCKSLDSLIDHLGASFMETNVELPDALAESAKKLGIRQNEYAAMLLNIAINDPVKLVPPHLHDSPLEPVRTIYDSLTLMAKTRSEETGQEHDEYLALSWWMSLIPLMANGTLGLASPQIIRAIEARQSDEES